MELIIDRWLHIWAGIAWIGLLYYFNAVQAPGLAAAKADGTAAGIGIGNAFLLKSGAAPIGIGAWLGTIMFLNVWFLIWPNQKKVLGIVPADDATKAKAARVAFLASRTNTMLSIPMIFFMVVGAHGLPKVL